MERNASAHTCRNYRDDLAAFCSFLGPRALRSVTPLEVRQFLAHQSTQRYAKRTIARRLSCVRSFFRFLCREGLLDRNPAAVVPAPRLEHRLPAFLDEAQVVRLLQAPSDGRWQGVRDRAMLSITEGGSRPFEMRRVSVELHDRAEIQRLRDFCDEMLTKMS